MQKQKTNTIKKLLLYLYLLPLLAFAIWSEVNVYQYAHTRAELKKDFSEVNSIQQGLLSVNEWKGQIKNILTTQIDSFNLSPGQNAAMRKEVSDILNSLITKADSVVQNHDKSIGKRLRKFAVNVFIDKEELRNSVPDFSEAIIAEIQKPESKERLRKLAHQKLDEFSEQTYDDSDSLMIREIFDKHEVADHSEFNDYSSSQSALLDHRTYAYMFLILLVVILYLVPWIFVHLKNWTSLRKPLFNMSILLSISVLVLAVSTSMIEIDARLNKVDFVLLGQHIQFNDQILFFRSKSILEVVEILMKTKKFDSILVGVLILAFSVLFPTAKMIATEIYLFSSGKIKNNALIKWLTFKSGKWSMADVMVVAIFMAYVGFNGILDNQMGALNIQDDSLTSIATNQTALRPGFILFLTFVLFSLFLSALLKWVVSSKPDNQKI